MGVTGVSPQVGSSVSTAATLDAPVTVLCVDDDQDFLDLTADMLDEASFDVRTETSPVAAVDRIDDVDCVVSDYRMPTMDGLELLATIREDRPTLPVVFCTGSSVSDLTDAVTDSEWTDVVRKDRPDVTAALLRSRVRGLVARDRTTALARRAMAALDESSDAVAVVTPAGRFAVVNQAFARQFGYDREELLDRDWRGCYPDGEVERLESTAMETVTEDWQWTGGCVGKRENGNTFTARTRIVGLDDGSVVFCVSEASSDE